MNKKIICLAVSAAMAVSLSTAFSITSFAENESSAESYAESVTTQESESSDAENSRKEESSKQESREKQKYTLTVISEETGKTTTVKNVVEGTSVMSLIDNKTLDFALLDAEGYIFSRLSRYPLSHFKNAEEYMAEIKSNNAYNTTIYSDTKLYAVYFKHVDSIDVKLDAPICGVETDVDRKSKHETTSIYDYSTQTNKPEFSCDSEGVALTGGWTISNGNLQNYFDNGTYLSDPFICTFDGGKNYHVTFSVDTKLGYYLDNKTGVTVNGDKTVQYACHSDIDEIRYSASIDTDIKAVHDAENGKCKVCGKKAEEVTSEISEEVSKTDESSAESSKQQSSQAESSESTMSDAQEFQSYLLSEMTPVFIILGSMILVIVIIKIVGAVRNKKDKN